MASRYDDELWELVPEARGVPRDLAAFVAGLDRARHALDLGCGDGALSASIPADRLTLADVSRTALDRACRRLPDARAVELAPDDALPFGDGEFDLVVCTETLEHVRDVQLLLSEARRVLEPGGVLAITTPSHRWPMAPPDPLTPHLRFFTKRSLRALLDAMGFDIRTLARRGGGLFAVVSR
jgi:ubiquinone/menaquinone biosynthesis C-methylase UbiE